MNYRIALLCAILGVAASQQCIGGTEKQVVTSRPNLLFILADDLGYGDLGCYGATKIKTPNIDQLAKQGVRFTDAHAPAAVCQPSRYAILSGNYFMRAKRQGNQTLYFHEGQVTLPSLLKSAGYRTAAIGKWHLGFGRGQEPDYNKELKPGPLEIGFDSYFGCPRTHNEPPFVFVENHRMVGADPADPIRIIDAKDTKKGWGHGISEGAAAAHAARPEDRVDLIFADKAVEFLGRKSDAPFFMYLAFVAPHVPISPAPEFKGTSQAGTYGDFVQQLDACVGRVLEALKASGQADNTLVIFASDNGGLMIGNALVANGHRANGALLGQKTDAWEGGHRIPFIARWPGRIPEGTKSDALLCLTDVMATLVGAAGVSVPAGAAPDSINQLPVLTDPLHASPVRTEALAQGTGGYSLRQGEWVFLPKQGSCGMTVQSPLGAPWGLPYAKMGVTNSDITVEGKVKADAPPVQLYRLSSDPRQQVNLAVQEPQRASEMRKRLEELLPPPRQRSDIPNQRPALWAVYYAWYTTATGPHGKESMWCIAGVTNAVPKPRGKVQPLIGYYDSDNPEVVRWHMRLAKAAGIDAFLVSWWGGASVSGKAFEQVIVPTAAKEGVKVAMCSELAQFHHDVIKLAKETAATLKRVKDSPAYLRLEGKPVVYLYQVPFDPKLTPETFGQLQRGVEAEVGPVYWIMDKVSNANNTMTIPANWLDIPDIPMFGFYGTFSIKRVWAYDDLMPDYRRVAEAAHAKGKKVFLPVHPGHDNSGFRPDDFFVIPHDNGKTLRGYLRLATDAGADAILVTSFNEWPETTVVEPSSSWADPYQYLKILAEWKGIPFVTPARIK
jgi:arylsulfatase A-like enzyme